MIHLALYIVSFVIVASTVLGALAVALSILGMIISSLKRPPARLASPPASSMGATVGRESGD